MSLDRAAPNTPPKPQPNSTDGDGSASGGLCVALVGDVCSMRRGGEAALPLHYFRGLRARGVDAMLICHGRNGQELREHFPEDMDRIFTVTDDLLTRGLHRLGELLPDQARSSTFGVLMLMYTQWRQRKLLRRLVAQRGLSIVHQVAPVSPRYPSMLFNIGVPVIMGPLNGGMAYPPAFAQRQPRLERMVVSFGRRMSNLLNRLIPGKRRAALLLAANQRTLDVLPTGGVDGSASTDMLVENGVDLSRWRPAPKAAEERGPRPVRFVYVGRLVDWKAVDLLLEAWAKLAPAAGSSTRSAAGLGSGTDGRPAGREAPSSSDGVGGAGDEGRGPAATLEIIGEGVERPALDALCEKLGQRSTVRFAGWLDQAQCARRLNQADVLVLSSLRECGGAVVLEAMAMGLAVIGPAWGGPADYIDPTCGILVPPDSRTGFVEGLAGAMRRLVRDPALRAAMGRAGQHRVAQRFSWERKVDRIITLYRRTRGASTTSADPPTARAEQGGPGQRKEVRA